MGENITTDSKRQNLHNYHSKAWKNYLSQPRIDLIVIYQSIVVAVRVVVEAKSLGYVEANFPTDFSGGGGGNRETIWDGGSCDQMFWRGVVGVNNCPPKNCQTRGRYTLQIRPPPPTHTRKYITSSTQTTSSFDVFIWWFIFPTEANWNSIFGFCPVYNMTPCL